MKREWKSRRWKWMARGALVGAIVCSVMGVASGWFKAALCWGGPTDSIFLATETWQIRLTQGRVRLMRFLPDEQLLDLGEKRVESSRKGIAWVEDRFEREKTSLAQCADASRSESMVVEQQKRLSKTMDEFLVPERKELKRREEQMDNGRKVSVYWQYERQQPGPSWQLLYASPRTMLFFNWDASGKREYASTSLLPVVVVLGGLATFAFVRGRRVGEGCCRKCGYDLRASPGRCPECGQQPGGGVETPTQGRAA